MRILYDNEIDKDQWNDLVSKSPYSTPFQSYPFYTFINNSNEQQAVAIAIEDNSCLCLLVVVIIFEEKGFKSFFSKRGIIFGGPILTKEGIKYLPELLDQIKKRLKKRVSYIETRNFNDYTEQDSDFKRGKWEFTSYLNIRQDLSSVTTSLIPSLFKYNRRREVKQSITNGATYRECSSIEELKQLYSILSELYKKQVKLPIPSYDFFKQYYLSGLLKVFVVCHNDLVIGGSLCPFLENKGIFTYYYCGQRSYNKKIFPTHLSILAAMEFGVKNNLKYIDFMGAGRPEEEYGVRNYKLEFGGSAVNLGRYKLITRPLFYFIGFLGLKILKKIK